MESSEYGLTVMESSSVLHHKIYDVVPVAEEFDGFNIFKTITTTSNIGWAIECLL